MSLLDISKKSVECSYYYLKDNWNMNILINNTLTYQRINFWLCKYPIRLKIDILIQLTYWSN